LLDDDDLNLDGPDGDGGDDGDSDLDLDGPDGDDLDDLDILDDDGPGTDDELDDLIDSDEGAGGAAAPAAEEEPAESLDLDDLDLDDSDDEAEAKAPAAAPKSKARPQSKAASAAAKSRSVKTTPRAASRSAKATPRSAARASGRRQRGTRAEHALVVSGQRRKNVWSGAGSINSRHELKYGEERRLTADVQHTKLSAAERAEALDRLSGPTAKERAARKAAERAEALEAASAKMHNVALYLTKYKGGPVSGSPSGMPTGPVADRLYQSALQKRKKLEELRKNYEEEIDRRHKLVMKVRAHSFFYSILLFLAHSFLFPLQLLVMKDSSARSAKILRKAEKTRPGLADRQTAYRRSTGGGSSGEGSEQLSQATFKKMLKRLKYEMKVSFSCMYRYISRESCSQFDSLPLTNIFDNEGVHLQAEDDLERVPANARSGGGEAGPRRGEGRRCRGQGLRAPPRGGRGDEPPRPPQGGGSLD
jgi:hypothetical protein